MLRRDFPLVRRHAEAFLAMSVFNGSDTAEESDSRVLPTLPSKLSEGRKLGEVKRM